jgi:PAS domain S-box-containing protein
MQNSTAKMAAIFEAAPCTIIAMDEGGQIETVNDAAERMFGYRKADLVGRSAAILMAPSGGAHETQMPGGEREITAQRADGTSFPAHLSIVEITQDGRSFSTGFLTDLTAMKRLERMQNEFVAMVNHELRTPLTSIKSALGIVNTGALGALTDEMRRMTEIAYSNCDRLIHIINDLLDMEKIASGALRFEISRISLREFLDGFLAANVHMGRDFEVELALAQAHEELEIDVDPERLSQVLTNLVSNALKFSPRGETVRIAAVRRGAWVRLSVEDHGPGISDAFKCRIFSRFAQEDSSTVRQKGGTGLGLSISKAIVEAHGGQIGFDTEIGRGTIFFIDLPLSPRVGITPVIEQSGDHRILRLPAEERA